MVKDPQTIWLGLEYFCNHGDELWSQTDEEFIRFAISELADIGLISENAVLDKTIVRVEKAYPAYFGTYNNFHVVTDYLDHFNNLFLVGRNGMHKYNNVDHSMLTAMTVVDNIINNVKEKSNIWKVNTEQEYNES